MGIDIVYLIRLIFDVINNILLVYYGIVCEFCVFDLDGNEVFFVKMVFGVCDIVFFKDRKIVVICGEDSILLRSVQLLNFNGN